MHPALLLPEIVSAILRTQDQSLTFLRTCLFVNRLFSLEASRILWEECGSGYRSYSSRRKVPRIRHLSEVISQDLPRAQFYANFIRGLSFSLDRSRKEIIAAELSERCEELYQLDFPALESLASLTASSIKPDALLHFTQYNLKNLMLYRIEKPSDEFMKNLAMQSPKLRSVWMSIRPSYDAQDVPGSGRLSAAGLIEYLNHSPSLSRLEMRDGFHDIWSAGVFTALASHRELKFLKVPDITQARFITNDKDAIKFSALKQLYTGTSDTALERLLPFITNLDELVLEQDEFPPSEKLLPLVSNLSNLTSLEISFPVDATISASDLLLLSKGCPNLQVLRLPKHPDENIPSSEDLDDSVIAEIAQNLKSLRIISLFTEPIQLTHQSVITLCQTIQGLEECGMAADIDFEVLADQDHSLFANIKSFRFILPGRGRPDCTSPKDLGSRLHTLMPNIYQFKIHDGENVDYFIEEGVMAAMLCYPRPQNGSTF